MDAETIKLGLSQDKLGAQITNLSDHITTTFHIAMTSLMKSDAIIAANNMIAPVSMASTTLLM